MSHREEIHALLSHSGILFEGSTLTDLMGPVVYLHLDAKDVPIYVGMSRRGLARLTSVNHHYFRRWHPELGQKLLIYPVKDVAAARRLEALLIKHLQPKGNHQQRASLLATRLDLTLDRARELKRALA